MRKISGIMAVLVFMSSQSFAAGMIQIKGSDTLINVVQKLAEDFMAQKSGAMISVTGGGSGTGAAALANKKCDIANMSRTMKDKEMASAVDAGVDVKRVILAIDGLSVIVNANNSVTKLTVDQIGKIYRGEIKNWNEVGGNDTPISLYGRQSNSGTYGFFQELALKGEYSGLMRQMNGNSQIVESVKTDIGGIGYVGVGYAKEATGVTVLDVAMKVDGEYFSPLQIEAVKSGKYLLARPLNQYINGIPGGAVKDFIAYELSPEGQKVIEEMGFLGISGTEYEDYNAKLGF